MLFSNESHARSFIKDLPSPSAEDSLDPYCFLAIYVKNEDLTPPFFKPVKNEDATPRSSKARRILPRVLVHVLVNCFYVKTNFWN